MATHLLPAAFALLLAACSGLDSGDGGTPDAIPACTLGVADGAYSTQLAALKDQNYYLQQANRYFDGIDVTAPATSVPTYSTLVARWEWPPWLKLTGYGGTMMAQTDKLVKGTAPASIAPRDCRYFAVQPFARCRVSFNYMDMGGGKPCLIYEEFTFNDAGEITFVEAWSDLPQSLPSADPADLWAEGDNVHRLSTHVPGLGTPTGLIDPTGSCMAQAAAGNADVADFAMRAGDFWNSWLSESAMEGKDYFARGCGW